MTFPDHLTADEVVDELKRQLRPLVGRGLKPDHMEMWDAYAAKLDTRSFKAHLVVIALNERDDSAFGGVPMRPVASPGILRVVV